MKTKTVGIIEKVSKTEKTLADMKDVVRAQRGLRLNERRLLNRMYFGDESTKKKRLEVLHQTFGAIRALQDCATLETVFEFDQIELDRSCTQKVKAPDGRMLTIPLIWVTALPAKAGYMTQKVSVGDTVTSKGRVNTFDVHLGPSRTDYNVRCLVPTPHPEALKLFKEHKDKFDEMQMWWVPNNIEVSVIERPKPVVTAIPRPDPILVGVKRVPGLKPRYYSLFRWIDEAYESGWWAREAY